MKGSLISLVLRALLVIISLFQQHQHNKLVGADSTYQNIPSASQNNTDKGANGCIGLQCQVVVDDEADLFMEYQQATGSSRLLAAMDQFKVPHTMFPDVNDGCPPNGGGPNSYISCAGGYHSPQNGGNAVGRGCIMISMNFCQRRAS